MIGAERDAWRDGDADLSHSTGRDRRADAATAPGPQPDVRGDSRADTVRWRTVTCDRPARSAAAGQRHHRQPDAQERNPEAHRAQRYTNLSVGQNSHRQKAAERPEGKNGVGDERTARAAGLWHVTLAAHEQEGATP